MARTPSNMLPLGTVAPSFSLPDTVSGGMLGFDEVAGDKATVVMFICNHCPFVIHIHSTIVALAAHYQSRGIGFVAISSNDVDNYPDDSPEKMKALAESLPLRFPYLYDETQSVAKAYDAACTPDFYVFDRNKQLAYRGQLDGSRPGNDIASDGADIRAALDALLAGGQPNEEQMPSLGCNIKWKDCA